MAAAVQETAARLGLSTGRGLGSLIRDRFPRPILYGALLVVLAANTFNIGADVSSMAAAARLVVDIPDVALVIVMTIGMLTLELSLPYHRYARILRWLALSLVAYVIVLFTVHIDWGSVGSSLLHPRLPGTTRVALAALIAVFGTTVSPYLFFWQASEEVEEQHEPQGEPPSRLTARHVEAMRVDVIGGMLSAVGIAFVIVLVGASTLHRAGLTRIATAQQAADALKPFAGDVAQLVFAIGIVGLGLIAVPVLAGSSAYALSEAFAWREGLSRTFKEARGFYTVLIASMLSGAIIGFVGFEPIRALYYAAILNGIAAPPLIILMLLLARDHRVCGEHRSKWFSTSLLLITIVASVGLPLWYLLA
jgi:Mn2+/Fe2+ NRAMP family transporter